MHTVERRSSSCLWRKSTCRRALRNCEVVVKRWESSVCNMGGCTSAWSRGTHTCGTDLKSCITCTLLIGACSVYHTMTSLHLHEGLKLKPATIRGANLWGDSESISPVIHRFSIKIEDWSVLKYIYRIQALLTLHTNLIWIDNFACGEIWSVC